MTNPSPSPSTPIPPAQDAGIQGQKYAFATASLLMGIVSFTSLLGVEKALLAILFGWLALRPPGARLRRGWAIAGIALGALMIIAVAVVVIVKLDELTRLVEYLQKFG